MLRQRRFLDQTEPDPTAPTPVTSHPRLWLTGGSAALRAWATDANPIWRDGFWPPRRADDRRHGRRHRPRRGRRQLDAGRSYPTESYAELFAFLSLVHPDEAAGRTTPSAPARC